MNPEPQPQRIDIKPEDWSVLDQFEQPSATDDKQDQPQEWTDESLARFFHDTYEILAPSFGYETRKDTREFNPESQNGRLMVTVCGAVLLRFNAALAAEQEKRETVERDYKIACTMRDNHAKQLDVVLPIRLELEQQLLHAQAAITELPKRYAEHLEAAAKAGELGDVDEQYQVDLLSAVISDVDLSALDKLKEEVREKGRQEGYSEGWQRAVEELTAERLIERERYADLERSVLGLSHPNFKMVANDARKPLVDLLQRARRNVEHSASHQAGAASRELLKEIDAAIADAKEKEDSSG